ncbi:SDR family NAD(P)-dependent oxidoreductase [Cerasicoccus frondis]|uniref:SDR family NAD(P)-dependent oxidoreductase n=1 Tax=Cerasicoccus frondis TaxID=490090 RepID=UPI0028525F66|nr:SDR family oxidoreductase [Cerasicoccus frondis]
MLPTQIEQAFSLSGRVALITGGGSGIGRAIAECFHAAGAHVIIASRNRDNLKTVAGIYQERFDYEQFDVSSSNTAEGLIQKVIQKHQRLDCIVHCAGIHLKAPALETSPEELTSVLQTHLIGAHALSIAAAAPLRKHQGNLLFIASMASYIGLPNVCAYASAKSAILGYVRSLASEWSPHGIRVNAIAPGWIETPMLQRALEADPDRKERILQRTPLKRLGAASEIGWAALYLCSPAASFITGTTLTVDGGASIGF